MADVASSQVVTASQMSTQSLRETQESTSQMLDMSVGEEAVWGRLLAMRANVRVYHLSDNSYCFGRGAVDHQLREDNFDISLLPVISKKHFRIFRENRAKSLDGPVVYIEDLSSNGTYLNQRLIGKNKRAILRSNDEIGLAQINKKVFMFYDCENNDAEQFPSNLTAKYTVTKKIGEGTYGEVRLAYRQENLERCAIKILKKKMISADGTTFRMSNISQIENEVQLLQSVDHTCIVRLWDVFENSERIFMVMELAEGGELFDRITGNGRLPEPVTKFYCYQLALAIHYLHQRGITHRDLKPENILLANDDIRCCVKLTDFGLSKLTVDASQMSTFCGTTMYIAPELLELTGRAYTKKVDLWSFGVVIFVCLAGYPPFHDPNNLKLQYLIRMARYNFDKPVWKEVSEEAKSLIKSLLVADPDHRYDTSQALKHPWFTNDTSMIEEAAQVMRRSEDRPSRLCGPPATENGHGPQRTGNKRALGSPEAAKRMQNAKTPRLALTEATLNNATDNEDTN